jgi:hypothetical protein
VNGLGTDIEVEFFTNNHIRAIAPFILGPTAYLSIAEQHFNNFWEFQQYVESKYGLSKRQLLDTFY